MSLSVVSTHSELITALTNLYTLLVACTAVEPSLLRLPDPDTGQHPPNSVATATAQAAGYSSSATDLLTALPYLNVSHGEVEILPSTYSIDYLGEDLDEGDPERHHDMFNEAVMPPTAVKLTHSMVYGVAFVYDVETKLVSSWHTFEGLPESNDYFDVPAIPPESAFAALIEGHQSLDYLPTPEGMDYNSVYFSQSNGTPPKDYGPKDANIWRAEYDAWVAMRKIKNIYLECCWAVDKLEQINFRRDEFLRKRKRYWKDVVMLLIEKGE